MSATEAAKNFGRLVDRVREERTPFVVERGGTAVVRVSPVEDPACTIGDLKSLLALLPQVDAEYLDALERAADRHNKPRRRRHPWGR